MNTHSPWHCPNCIEKDPHIIQEDSHYTTNTRAKLIQEIEDLKAAREQLHLRLSRVVLIINAALDTLTLDDHWPRSSYE